MLDEDLAELYQATTSDLNKDVARNIKRFQIVMFRLTNEKYKNLIFQNGITSEAYGELRFYWNKLLIDIRSCEKWNPAF